MSNEIFDFVHLHLHTEYSLLDGASRIDKLAKAVKNKGMKAVAITDHGVMYGVPFFCREMQKNGIKPIIGCEVYVALGDCKDKSSRKEEPYYHLVLLVKNKIGYHNLIKLVSLGFTEGFYRKPRVDKALLRNYSEGLIALSACLQGEIACLLLDEEKDKAKEAVREYVDIFGQENFYLEIEDHGIEEQKNVNELIWQLSKEMSIELVATNDVHYLEKEDAKAHDVLLCIQTAATVDNAKRMKFFGTEFYLKSPQEMQKTFFQEKYLNALKNTAKIAAKCNYILETGNSYLPNFFVPNEFTENTYLEFLCKQSFEKRYAVNDKSLKKIAEKRMRYELDVIFQMKYAGYFLIVWDFIEEARKKGIAVGPGRGSAAGSIVAYLLNITNIEPLENNLLFERFLNPERISMPDIDTDICYERRNEVVEHLKKRYGTEKVSQIITFGTMAARAAIRDVGRAMNISYGEVDKIAKMVPQEIGMTLEKAWSQSIEFREHIESNKQYKELFSTAVALEGLPRHASVHAAGVVVAKDEVTSYVPVQKMSDGAVVTQYDMSETETIGLLKMDLLGLRTLTVIAEAVRMINEHQETSFDINQIPLSDRKVGEMLSRGETEGVFQMESSGMTKLVCDLKPSSFKEMIPLVALYRPGPLESGMVGDFCKGKRKEKQVTYLHPLLEPILEETFGVILYQEQVMRIASDLAGFSLGQADLLRKAMGKKKPEVIAGEKNNFIKGAEKKGISADVASEIFDLMAHFAGYGFNKSHSAAYALVAYQTAYLKANYTKEFMAALLTSVNDDNSKVGYYIDVCRYLKIKVLSPNINKSQKKFSVEEKGIRFGLTAVKNVGEGAVDEIIKVRNQNGEFKDLLDFCSKIDLRYINKRVLENLIKCGAFDNLGASRSQHLLVMEETMIRGAKKRENDLTGQLSIFMEDEFIEELKMVLPEVDELPKKQLLNYEKDITGFYITGHPLDEFANNFKIIANIISLKEEQFKDGSVVSVGGLVTSIKHILTKKGDNMCVFHCEDFTGSIEIVLFPKLYAEYSRLLCVDKPVFLKGKLQKDENIVKLIAEQINSMEDMVIVLKILESKQEKQIEKDKKIFQIIKKHQGKQPVMLYDEEKRKPKLLNEKYWVNFELKLIDKLTEFFGKGYVKWDLIKSKQLNALKQ